MTGAHGDWEAILTEDEWRAYMAMIDPRRTGPRTGKVTTSLLSKIATCGKCRALVVGGRNNRGTATYRCSDHPHLARGREPIDAVVVEDILERLARPDAEALVEDTERMERLTSLRSQAAVVRARLDEVAVMFGDGDMTRAQFQAASNTARARLADLESEQDTLSGGNVLAGLVGASDVRAAWEALDIDRQRSIVAALVKVTILGATTGRTFDPGSVQVVWADERHQNG